MNSATREVNGEDWNDLYSAERILWAEDQHDSSSIYIRTALALK